MGKYRSEGIGKNKKIRAERHKPIPISLMKIDKAITDINKEYKERMKILYESK